VDPEHEAQLAQLESQQIQALEAKRREKELALDVKRRPKKWAHARS
jgi:hypothetical protein